MAESGLDELTRGIFGFTKTTIAISFMDEAEVIGQMLDHFKEVLEKNGVEIINQYNLGLGWAQFTITNLTEFDVYCLFPLLSNPNNRIHTILSKAAIMIKRPLNTKHRNGKTLIPEDLILYWAEDQKFYRIK